MADCKHCGKPATWEHHYPPGNFEHLDYVCQPHALELMKAATAVNERVHLVPMADEDIEQEGTGAHGHDG